jgi:riboflavin synthase
MFTGLVEEVGRIERIEPRDDGMRLWVRASRVLADARIGDSLALDGCCLTLVAVEPERFAVDAVPETLARTTLGRRAAGDGIHLERALRLDARLGGHLMQGHVDGIGRVSAMRHEGEGRRVTIEVPEPLRRFVAEKGSIAVDGVSLTVAAVTPTGCELALIPHTLAVTSLGAWTVGRTVNLEMDLIARYLARLLDDSHSRRTA